MIGNGAVLVTGATGFLGSHLVRRLVADGRVVHVLARAASSFRRLGDLEAKLVRWAGDVTDLESLVQCCRGARPEVIYHLAGDTAGRRLEGEWSPAEQALRVNVQGTLNLLRAAAVLGHPLAALVRAGGLEEYGAGPVPFTETQREEPRSPYSASQVTATHWCRMLQPQLDFSVLTLRPALVYGPGQSADFLIPGLIRALLRGERFALSDGRQRRDLLFVGDFVAAAVKAGARSDLRGAIINITTGESHAIRDVATWIARELDSAALLDIGAVPPRTMEIPDLVGCNALASRLLDWRPEVGLTQGLRLTVDWYRGDAARTMQR